MKAAIYRFLFALGLTPITSANQAATVTLPATSLLRSDSRLVEQDTPWNGHRFDDRLTISVATVDGDYIYCRHSVTERSRNPHDRKPADDYAGYRLVSTSEKTLQWQWWVMPWGRWADQRQHWLVADFNAVWIKRTATANEMNKNRCIPVPRSDPVRTWPVENSTAGTAPPSRTEYFSILRLYCDPIAGPAGQRKTYVDSSSSSNKSCQDARAVIELHVQSVGDICKVTAPVDTHVLSGEREWISTRSCP